MGALIALEFCRDLRLQEVIFKGDVELVVKAVNKKSHLLCRYGQIVEDMKNSLAGFRSQQVIHVKRGAIEAAHGLAKQATGEYIDKMWMEMSPSSISNIVLSEQHALSVYSFILQILWNEY